QALGNRGVSLQPSSVVVLSDSKAAKEFIRKNHDGEEKLSDLDVFGSLYLPSGAFVVYSSTQESRAAFVVSALVDVAVHLRDEAHAPAWLIDGISDRLTW